MDIEIVMKRLYESEINFSISSFWDNGWDVKPGDEMNGFKAEGNFRTLDEAAAFLDFGSAKALPRIRLCPRQGGARAEASYSSAAGARDVHLAKELNLKSRKLNRSHTVG